MLFSFYYDFDSKKHKFKFETVTLFQSYNRPTVYQNWSVTILKPMVLQR